MSIKPVEVDIFQYNQIYLAFSKSEKRRFFTSLAIILASSTIFGLWFKIKQISIASPEIVSFYPLTGYGIAVLQSMFFFAVLWLGLALVCRLIDRDKNIINSLLAGSLPFTAFMLSLSGVEIFIQFRCFFLLAVIVLCVRIYGNRPLLEEKKEPIVVLILLFLAYLHMYKSLSPLFDTGFFRIWGRLDFLVNLEHQFENANAYDFLGNFTQRGKLGGYTQGLYMVSELLSLMVLLLDIPLVDDLNKYGLINHLYFYLYVFGSYGCYLFLRRGLKLSFLPSLIGGLGFIFGNASFVSFFGAEWPIHQMPFVFFPWVCLLLKRAYDLNKVVLLCAAGLVASFSEYATSSHPEINMGYLFFCNAYNLYLAFFQLTKDRFEWKSIRYFFVGVFVFPVFHLVGLSYKLIPLFEAIITREYVVYDVVGAWHGLGWLGDLKHYSTFFFRFEDASKVLSSDLPYFSPTITGTLVYFYTGQFATLMIFCFIFFFFGEVWRKFFKKDENAERSTLWGNASYFLLMFFILLTIMPMGNRSWLSKLMAWLEFLRVNRFVRVNIYYYFIALVSAMCGLEYVLRQKKLFEFSIIFGLYLLTLLGVYLSPMLMALPEKVLFDGAILVATYFSIALLIKPNILFKNRKLSFCQPLLHLMVILVAFYSLLTTHTRCYEFITQKNNLGMEFNKDKLFISFRAQVAYLRNNLHDRASFKFLEQRLEKFVNDVDDKTWQSKNFSATRESLAKIVSLRQEITSQSDTQRAIQKLKLFEEIAPEVDSFYLNYGPSWVLIGVGGPDWGPLAPGIYNGIQYYLPDKYQLFVSLGGSQSLLMMPIGKNSDLMGAPYFTSGPGYPSINVNFHLRSLFHDSLHKLEVNGVFDYNSLGLEMEQITTNKNAKKLLNIVGVDYLIFVEYYLKSQPSPSLSLDKLKSIGLIPVVLPESSKFTPRFSADYEVRMFNNPESYGKAYIAKWVKIMKPEENMLNLDWFHLPKGWVRSKDLLRDFEFNLAKIPDEIEKAALIESSDPGDYSESPRTYGSDNNVDIVKIIGSKAVFDVDCTDESCWLVYNSAVLKGWEAFSGSTRLPIYTANMGFVGLKLNKGKHFVWMEYRPFSLPLSFMVMLAGWISVLAIILFDGPRIARKDAD